MANEITKITDQKTGVDHLLRDAAAQTALTGILTGQSIDSFGDVESAVKANTKLIKDTVGWSGKNKLKIPASVVTQEINGITFTVNRDTNGEVTSIVADGTASANISIEILNKYNYSTGRYIISKGYSTSSTGHMGLVVEAYNNNTWVKLLASSWGTDEAAFDVDNNGYNRIIISIKIDTGNVLTDLMMYPMLRDASILDPTFEPYHESVQDILDTKYTVSVTHTGTASSTGVRKQQITVNNVSYDVDGSAYMEQSVTLSTSQATDVVFTNAIIADGTELTFSSSIWDLVPDDMVTTTGVCTVTLPKWTSAVTIGCRLRVR